MRVVLASASPRRRALLKAAGVEVVVAPQDVDESPIAGESVEDQVVRLASLKLQSCTEAGLAVIAADTLVALEGRALGQPATLAEANTMIRQLSGREHTVFSGVAVGYQGRHETALVATRVRFRPISDTEITCYLQHNQVLDKAGGYAIQEGAASFITAIDGPLDNVIGLPVQQTLKLLHRVTKSDRSHLC